MSLQPGIYLSEGFKLFNTEIININYFLIILITLLKIFVKEKNFVRNLINHFIIKNI